MPEGMGVILRTAGASRTKTEVKRDFEYLLRLWETVRDLTLKSTAPTLVYEEGSLIKRSIRDLYNKDIDEILVAGDDGLHGSASDFMRMLMPSHAKNVKLYQRHASRSSPATASRASSTRCSRRSCSCAPAATSCINQTEALVAIDVNSGRATREHHIEDTALKTNLEAAEEIARQLRLRDLAGLIVIDFIDMDEKRNNRTVERRLKECLQERPRAHPGRAHLAFRPAGDVAPAHPLERAGKLDREVPALRRHRPRALGLVGRAAAPALARGNAAQGRDAQSHRAHAHRDRALCAQSQARASARAGGALPASPSRSMPMRRSAAQVPFVIEKGEQVHSLEQARALAQQPSAPRRSKKRTRRIRRRGRGGAKPRTRGDDEEAEPTARARTARRREQRERRASGARAATAARPARGGDGADGAAARVAKAAKARLAA